MLLCNACSIHFTVLSLDRNLVSLHMGGLRLVHLVHYASSNFLQRLHICDQSQSTTQTKSPTTHHDRGLCRILFSNYAVASIP